jgi:hypothetical protein
MVSLWQGLAMGGRVWLSDLPSYRGSGLELGRVQREGFGLVKSGRGKRRRGGRLPVLLGLWDELPCGRTYLGYSSNL